MKKKEGVAVSSPWTAATRRSLAKIGCERDLKLRVCAPAGPRIRRIPFAENSSHIFRKIRNLGVVLNS